MIANNIDGKIKTYPNGIPEKFNGIHAYNTLPADKHLEDGFREVVIPQVIEGKKLGAIEYDAANDVFTYPLIDKTPEELVAENDQKKQVEKEKIKQKYIDQVAEDKIALNVADGLKYFPEWMAGTHAKDVKRVFKGKLFSNDVEGNTNAPDKGGWTEIK